MKLTTPEQKLIEAAKLDGLTERQSDDHLAYAWFDGNRQISAWLNEEWRIECPRKYATSYDAIIPLIQKQPYEVLKRIDEHYELVSFAYEIPSPSQLLDALLLAHGFEL